jgi:hypothetical protein
MGARDFLGLCLSVFVAVCVLGVFMALAMLVRTLAVAMWVKWLAGLGLSYLCAVSLLGLGCVLVEARSR